MLVVPAIRGCGRRILISSQLGLQSKFEASLGYIVSLLQNTNKNK
jgi:hypothetical protein